MRLKGEVHHELQGYVEERRGQHGEEVPPHEGVDELEQQDEPGQ